MLIDCSTIFFSFICEIFSHWSISIVKYFQLINYHNRLTWFNGKDIEDFIIADEIWSFELEGLFDSIWFNNVFVLIEQFVFLIGKEFDIVDDDNDDDGGKEENFLRKTAIGGNSTPRNVFVGNRSVLFVSFWVDIVQRSCIFLSRRDIFSFCFVDNDSIASIDDDDDDDDICSFLQSRINPVQILFLFVISVASIMSLVLFEACSIVVDDPSI